MTDKSTPNKLSKSKLTMFLGGNAHATNNTPDVKPSSLVKAAADQKDTWATALNSFDTSSLVKLMIDEVAKVPFKKKREFGVTGDYEVVQKLLSQMSDLLGSNFLHIDFKSPSRDVQNSDWSKVNSCRRSDSGTTGIYFIQCTATGSRSCTPPPRGRSPINGLPSPAASSTTIMTEYNEIIVAKPVSKEDFERQMFINEITKEYFKIHTPAIRFISKSDDEFKVLEEAVKNLFLPFHEDVYTAGGQGSPKALFESHAIMLMELVKGKPLCHRTEGQRILKDEDYRAVGRLFLLDLLIRNTDRLPCRRAIPRPGSVSINDHGNAGNLMFGDMPGSLWAIDPEMQTNIDANLEAEYIKSIESILLEILNDELSHPRYKALDTLFFTAIPGLNGILDNSLEEFSPWANASMMQQEAIASILTMIRIRAKAEDSAIITRNGGILPPESNYEREWREWIRISQPRAVLDVLKFIEVYTGHKCPPTAASRFEQGFLEALAGAIEFQRELKSPFGSIAVKRQFLFKILLESNQIDVGFIRRMIDALSKIFPASSSYAPPTATCDDEVHKLSRLMTGAKKKFITAADRLISPKSDFLSATAAFVDGLSQAHIQDLPSPAERESYSQNGSTRTSSSTNK